MKYDAVFVLGTFATSEGYEKAIGTVYPGKSPPTVRASWTGVAGLQAPSHKFVFHDGDPPRIVVSIQGNAYHCECGAETPSDHAGTCKAPFWIREASLATWCEWRRTGDVAAAEKACREAQIGAAVVTFVAGLKRWAASPEGKRTAQERALVALVSACPPDLDPIGWRAAVLAYAERPAAPESTMAQVIDSQRSASVVYGMVRHSKGDIYDAYHRAITPAAPVPRVRATWKTRGPVLAVDDGRDE